jgi:hypothetical protein
VGRGDERRLRGAIEPGRSCVDGVGDMAIAGAIGWRGGCNRATDSENRRVIYNWGPQSKRRAARGPAVSLNRP